MIRPNIHDPIPYSAGPWDSFIADEQMCRELATAAGCGITRTDTDHGSSVRVDSDVPLGQTRWVSIYDRVGPDGLPFRSEVTR